MNLGLCGSKEELEEKYDNQNYIVVIFDARWPEKLITEVNNLMELGYNPLGGVATKSGGGLGSYVLQAMVKSEGI